MAAIPSSQTEVSGRVSGGEPVHQYDAIVVGAGFSGIANLYRLRKDGLKVHVFEQASDFGGVWYWNRYPGARVDSETPFYQLNIPEVYNTWNFSSRFPDHRELRRYMAHCDKVLNLRKDVSFDTKVVSAEWDQSTSEWHIQTNTGKQARARFLILATGLLHRTYKPNFPGLEGYKGILHHSAAWPEDISVKRKKVCVIGAGSTSVQIVQEVGKEAAELTIMMRRPSYCLPLRQRKMTEEEQKAWKGYYPALFKAGRNSAVGFPLERNPKRVQDATPEEREQYLESIWNGGGFHFMVRNYNNVTIDKEANKIVYEFWKKKVRARITDPAKAALMAPDTQPFYFSTKRSPLENDYYDIINQDNVSIVDLTANPLETFTENGIKLSGEDSAREFDVVVLATGFDSFTGSLAHMGLKNKDGVDVKDIWASGVRTYLGMTMHGFPNAFMVYTPHAPTVVANGPTIIEAQTDFICDTIAALRAQGAVSIEPTTEAEEEWKAKLNAQVGGTLFPFTNSWWNGSNVPGKKAENMTYIAGIHNYEAECRATMVEWKGFNVVGGAAPAKASEKSATVTTAEIDNVAVGVGA